MLTHTARRLAALSLEVDPVARHCATFALITDLLQLSGVVLALLLSCSLQKSFPSPEVTLTSLQGVHGWRIDFTKSETES